MESYNMDEVCCLKVTGSLYNSVIPDLTFYYDYRKNNFKDRNKSYFVSDLRSNSKLKSPLNLLSYVSTTLKGINLGYKNTNPFSPENVMIIDGTGLAYRCYFALPDLKTSKGTDIGCLLGFMNSLARLYRMFEPKYMGLVFDSPGANDEKRDIWPEYKTNRQVVSQSFRNQLGWIREFCAILGLPVFIERSTEADDIITSMINFLREMSSLNMKRLSDDLYLKEIKFNKNTTKGIFDKYNQNFDFNSGSYRGSNSGPRTDIIHESKQTSKTPLITNNNQREEINLGYDVTVVTADKDLLQILSQNGKNKVNVKIVQPHKSWRIVNQNTVIKEYGIKPERFSEYLALVGDTADNIPGIMGIGPKTAPKLINKYETFDDILTSEEINKLSRKGGKYSESVKMAHDFHSIIKLKKNIRILTCMDQLLKNHTLKCQLNNFLKLFSLQKASSKWSMFTKPS